MEQDIVRFTRDYVSFDNHVVYQEANTKDDVVTTLDQVFEIGVVNLPGFARKMILNGPVYRTLQAATIPVTAESETHKIPA